MGRTQKLLIIFFRYLKKINNLRGRVIDLEKEQAEKRVEQLVKDLNYYTKKYFDDEQVISDHEYDMLMMELKEIG